MGDCSESPLLVYVGQEERQIPHWVQPSGGVGGEKLAKESLRSKLKDMNYTACIKVVDAININVCKGCARGKSVVFSMGYK
jgi:hypothetical protein